MLLVMCADVRDRLCGSGLWALCLYLILLFFFLAVITGIQLTLRHRGFVLGIGMAVDAMSLSLSVSGGDPPRPR
jgi:hypothetical protein